MTMVLLGPRTTILYYNFPHNTISKAKTSQYMYMYVSNSNQNQNHIHNLHTHTWLSGANWIGDHHLYLSSLMNGWLDGKSKNGYDISIS